MHDSTTPAINSQRVIGDYLGMSNGRPQSNGQNDIVSEYARRKRVPLEFFKRYGAHVAQRGKLTVARVPMYGPDGEQCSYIDFATLDEKWLKGVNAKGKPAGLFLKDGKLPKSGQTVHLVEGVKDAAALDAQGFSAVGLPTAKMPVKFARLFRGVHVIIIPDRDEAGESGAETTAARLAGIAASVHIAHLPGELKAKDGDGVREVVAKRDGERLLKQAIADALKWRPATDDGRPEIEVTPDEFRVNDAAAKALTTDESVYQRAGELVHVIRDDARFDGIERPEGSPRISTLPAAIVRDRLSSAARFVRIIQTKQGEATEHVHPPDWCVKAVHARGQWPGIRPLVGIVESPILRPNGTILDNPGYDPETGILYEPVGKMPKIPGTPTLADAKAALAELLDVIREFPFQKPEHKAAWIAGVLTPLARYAFSGPSPLFLIDANVPGSGKGLLADCTAIIATGRRMSVMSRPKADEETRKRITSLVLSGDPLVLIDNIVGNLGSASLDAALTATVWKDRILGRSEIVEMPLRATWYATGNNVVIVGDINRRICHVRLNSPLENPEERSGFRYPNLKDHVRNHRSKLLAAALTILRAWFAGGKPDMRLKTWGSFEGWSDVVRNAVVWCGLPDPGETREELRSRSDREVGALRALIEGWREIDPDGEGVTASQALKYLDASPDRFTTLREALTELCESKGGKPPSSRSLGNKLRHLQGRVVAGKAIDGKPDRKGFMRWTVTAVSADSADFADSSTAIPYARARAHAHAHAGLAETESADSVDSAGDPSQCERCGFNNDTDGPLCSFCNGGQ